MSWRHGEIMAWRNNIIGENISRRVAKIAQQHHGGMQLRISIAISARHGINNRIGIIIGIA